MKIFAQREVNEARAYAAAGGQALHLFDGAIADAIGAARKIPNCFRGRKELGHLFDQDAERLRKTARLLGVRVVVLHHAGTSSQHVDLCGGPLERAKDLARKAVLFHFSAPKQDTDAVHRAFLEGGLTKPGFFTVGQAGPEPVEFKQQYMGDFWNPERSPANTEGGR